jgi:hypothetical protein
LQAAFRAEYVASGKEAMPRAPRILIAIAAVVGGLLAPAAARADHGHPFVNADVQTYLQIAADHWGVPAPTCTAGGGRVIPVHVVLHDNPDPDVVATAEQPGCRMWLDRDWWPTPASRMACTTIAHEWGHLLGYGHSRNPRDLMYEEPLTGAPACSLFNPRISLGTAVALSSRPGRRRRHRAGRARRLIADQRSGRPGRPMRRRGAARR